MSPFTRDLHNLHHKAFMYILKHKSNKGVRTYFTQLQKIHALDHML